MAIALGKRKRRAEATEPVRKAPAPPVEPESDNEDLQAIFRKAFEAKFKPLEVEKETEPETVQEVKDGEEDSEQDSDWEGISEPEDAVEVIEHTFSQGPRERADKQALKAFMSSKPASFDIKPVTIAKQKAGNTEDDGTDAANLKNDLALQRLLTESHLLDPSSDTTPSGKNRHKATDLRLQALGSKASILAQEKMPMSHRKGINAKASYKEETRRKEAKENGIILERAAGKKAAPAQRERGIGGPSVGRFQGGTLTLSKRDIAGIQGPKKSGGKGKGGRGGKGGKRR